MNKKAQQPENAQEQANVNTDDLKVGTTEEDFSPENNDQTDPGDEQEDKEEGEGETDKKFSLQVSFDNGTLSVKRKGSQNALESVGLLMMAVMSIHERHSSGTSEGSLERLLKSMSSMRS
jgi:hypothetical protein